MQSKSTYRWSWMGGALLLTLAACGGQVDAPGDESGGTVPGRLSSDEKPAGPAGKESTDGPVPTLSEEPSGEPPTNEQLTPCEAFCKARQEHIAICGSDSKLSETEAECLSWMKPVPERCPTDPTRGGWLPVECPKS